jgi:DNA mismatch endonuclease (patch repair protein)
VSSRHDDADLRCARGASDVELEEVAIQACDVAELDLDEDSVLLEVAPKMRIDGTSFEVDQDERLPLPAPRHQSGIDRLVHGRLIDRQESIGLLPADLPRLSLRRLGAAAPRIRSGGAQGDLERPQDIQEFIPFGREAPLQHGLGKAMTLDANSHDGKYGRETDSSHPMIGTMAGLQLPNPAPTSPATRQVMKANRAKDTKPERTLRSALRAVGHPGYRLNWKQAPGRPDISYPGRRVAIFVHGCYWHHCPRCHPNLPKSNPEFWARKFELNHERDARKRRQLEEARWRVFEFWECDIRERLGGVIAEISVALTPT